MTAASVIRNPDRAEQIGLEVAVLIVSGLAAWRTLQGQEPAIQMALGLTVAATARLGAGTALALACTSALMTFAVTATSNPAPDLHRTAFHATAGAVALFAAAITGRFILCRTQLPPTNLGETLLALTGSVLVPAYVHTILLLSVATSLEAWHTVPTAIAGCLFAAPIAVASPRIWTHWMALTAGFFSLRVPP